MRHLLLLLLLMSVGCISYTPAVEPASWNQIKPGMTREQVHALVGKPASAENGVESWRVPAGPNRVWNLDVTYQDDGTVLGVADGSFTPKPVDQ